MLKWLRWPVCFSFLHISSILSGCCNRLGSGSKEWIWILRMRHPLLPNNKRTFWSMWRIKTLSIIDVCQSINWKAYRAVITSPCQWYQDPMNHPLIIMISPTMMKNTWWLTMLLRWHPDTLIVQPACWLPPGSVWIRFLKPQRTGGKSI